MSAIKARAVQRGRLLERIAQQRNTLTSSIAPITYGLQAADQILDGANKTRRWATENPLIAGAGLLALMIWRPKGIVRLAKNSAVGWRAWRLIRRLVLA